MATVKETAPLNSPEGKLSRRFLGNIFPKNTMEQKEYKSYLKGHTEYTYGRELVKTGKGYMIIPKTYDVRQEYFYK